MLGLYGMLEFRSCCEIVLLLNMADMGRLLCVRLNKAEYLVDSMHVNRLSACIESFVVVHSWQNGTRCRDGVKVLWCHSHLVWLVFSFFCCRLGMVREKKGGKGG